jgi:HD superfamily phosphodiesterase
MNYGTHVLNPYHNNEHQLQVAYHAVNAYMHDVKEAVVQKDIDTLVVAALFHDFDHSGGKLKDEENIQRALQFVQGSAFKAIAVKQQVEVEQVVELIRVTEFSGGVFPNEPQNLMAKALRDADLCSIFSAEGRMLIKYGLFEEINKKPIEAATLEEINNFALNNRKFLLNAKFYTTYGQRLKEDQLERCLRLFERHVGFDSSELS